LRLQLFLASHLRFEFLQVRSGVANARLELSLLDQPLGIGVDQFADLTLNATRLHLQLALARRLLRIVADVHASFVFFGDPLRLCQQRRHIGPDRAFQIFATQRSVVADTFLAHAMHDIADAPIVDTAGVAKAAHGIAATLAHHQSLQQILRALLGQAMPLLVLAQLLLHRLKQRFLDDDRHRNARPIFRRRAMPTDRTARLFASIALGALPRQTWNDLPFPVSGAALVGGIPKDAPDRAAVPRCPTTRRQDALFNEPAGCLADAQSLASDPAKDVLNDFCFSQAHLVTSVAACNSLGNVAISVGRVRHHADATTPSCV